MYNELPWISFFNIKQKNSLEVEFCVRKEDTCELQTLQTDCPGKGAWETRNMTSKKKKSTFILFYLKWRESSIFLFHSPTACRHQSWAMPKIGGGNLIWVSTLGDRNPVMSRKLGRKLRSQSALMWGVVAPASDLNAMPLAPAAWLSGYHSPRSDQGLPSKAAYPCRMRYRNIYRLSLRPFVLFFGEEYYNLTK